MREQRCTRWLLLAIGIALLLAVSSLVVGCDETSNPDEPSGAVYSDDEAGTTNDGMALSDSEEATVESTQPTDQGLPNQSHPAADDEFIVYKANTGEKYHLEGCRALKSQQRLTLGEAKALFLEPCGICNPPR